MTLSITLEQQAWQHILTLLSTHPYRESAPLIDAIREQAARAEGAQQPERVVPFPQSAPA